MSGRAYHEQLTHYLRKSFQYDTPGLASGTQVVWVGALPAGAIVRGTMVKVHTAFNSSVSDTLSVGSVSSPTGLVSGASIAAAGGQYAITGMDFTMPTALTDIYCRWIGSGDPPSTGSVTVIVEYFANNDQ